MSPYQPLNIFYHQTYQASTPAPADTSSTTNNTSTNSKDGDKDSDKDSDNTKYQMTDATSTAGDGSVHTNSPAKKKRKPPQSAQYLHAKKVEKYNKNKVKDIAYLSVAKKSNMNVHLVM